MKSFDRNDPELWALPVMNGINFIAWDEIVQPSNAYHGKNWWGFKYAPKISDARPIWTVSNQDEPLLHITDVKINFTENWQDSLTRRPKA